jgi:hypothetical protein
MNINKKKRATVHHRELITIILFHAPGQLLPNNYNFPIENIVSLIEFNSYIF